LLQPAIGQVKYPTCFRHRFILASVVIPDGLDDGLLHRRHHIVVEETVEESNLQRFERLEMVVRQIHFGKRAREGHMTGAQRPSCPIKLAETSIRFVPLMHRRPFTAPHHRLDAGTVCKP